MDKVHDSGRPIHLIILLSPSGLLDSLGYFMAVDSTGPPNHSHLIVDNSTKFSRAPLRPGIVPERAPSVLPTY